MKCKKSGNHTISHQSLLLSITVLNNKHLIICCEEKKGKKIFEVAHQQLNEILVILYMR